LEWLRSKSTGHAPSGTSRTSGPRALSNEWRPPVLMVIWAEHMVGVIRSLEIEHIKWSPDHLIPVRAYATLEVAEQVFFPELKPTTFGSGTAALFTGAEEQAGLISREQEDQG